MNLSQLSNFQFLSLLEGRHQCDEATRASPTWLLSGRASVRACSVCGQWTDDGLWSDLTERVQITSHYAHFKIAPASRVQYLKVAQRALVVKLEAK